MRFLRVASDLHLEWVREEKDRNAILPPDELDAESCLVLAGDIGAGNRLVKFITSMCERFERVLYVPGNHEYYHSKRYEIWNEEFKNKLSHLDNLIFEPGDVCAINIENVSFVFGTLWTDCNGGDPLTMMQVESCLNDFRVIPLFTAEKMIGIHAVEAEKIEKLLRMADPNSTRIVVTHHTPSHKLCHSKWGQTLVNAGFHSHCDKLLIEKWSPDIWIFGHTHDNIRKFIGNTLCFSNPRGYPNEASGRDFKDRLFFDLSTKSFV